MVSLLGDEATSHWTTQFLVDHFICASYKKFLKILHFCRLAWDHFFSHTCLNCCIHFSLKWESVRKCSILYVSLNSLLRKYQMAASYVLLRDMLWALCLYSPIYIIIFSVQLFKAISFKNARSSMIELLSVYLNDYLFYYTGLIVIVYD